MYQRKKQIFNRQNVIGAAPKMRKVFNKSKNEKPLMASISLIDEGSIQSPRHNVYTPSKRSKYDRSPYKPKNTLAVNRNIQTHRKEKSKDFWETPIHFDSQEITNVSQSRRPFLRKNLSVLAELTGIFKKNSIFRISQNKEIDNEPKTVRNKICVNRISSDNNFTSMCNGYVPKMTVQLTTNNGKTAFRNKDSCVKSIYKKRKNNRLNSSQEFKNLSKLIPSSSGSLYSDMKDRIDRSNSRVKVLMNENQKLNTILSQGSDRQDQYVSEEIEKLTKEMLFWKQKYDEADKLLLVKDKKIQELSGKLQHLEKDLVSYQEEAKSKEAIAKKGLEIAKNESAFLKQELEKANQKCSISQNDKQLNDTQTESYKLKIANLEGKLEAKDKAYNDIKQQIKDMKFELERLRIHKTSHIASMPLDSANLISKNIYESPISKIKSLSDITKPLLGLDSSQVPTNETCFLSSEEPKVTSNIDLASSPTLANLGYTPSMTHENYGSSSVGAALSWGSKPQTAAQLDRTQSPPKNQKFSSRHEELQFNLAEEQRLLSLIRDPPLQYRKRAKQQKLNETLKKVQRKVYELSFEIKRLT
ncbi:unnamed protein product [Moneuplotes crassus]|uniref:Uncharacterized protein n=1 Tax=Euplotes crassus TaxID=5936 RepID=A0AAD1Y932_EUPCR|nr:unnamed protein product [Moneuplotes crassus]